MSSKAVTSRGPTTHLRQGLTGNLHIPKRPKKGSVLLPIPSNLCNSKWVDRSQQSGRHQPGLTRIGALITLNPGSVLAKRIAYSNLTVMAPAGKRSTRKSQSGSLDDTDFSSIRRGRSLPLSVDPSSAFSKRHAYSELKGRRDALSQEMRNYFTNSSQINTWLMLRMVRSVNAKVEKISSSPPSLIESTNLSPDSSPYRNTSHLNPLSSLNKRRGYSSEWKGKRDALHPNTRDYFSHVSQTRTWSEERIIKAIYAEIERKYGCQSRRAIDLRPTRRFISSLLYLKPPCEMTFEELFQKVEVSWIKPRLSNHRRLYIASYMLTGLN